MTPCLNIHIFPMKAAQSGQRVAWGGCLYRQIRLSRCILTHIPGRGDKSLHKVPNKKRAIRRELSVRDPRICIRKGPRAPKLHGLWQVRRAIELRKAAQSALREYTAYCRRGAVRLFLYTCYPSRVRGDSLFAFFFCIIPFQIVS